MAERRGVTFEQLRGIMLSLRGVEDGSSYGTPGFRVAGKFMSRLREDDVLVLKPVEEVERQFLMETQPSAFFIMDHYRGSNAMLVRLSKVRAGELQELIERCWRELASKKMLAIYDAGATRAATSGVRRTRTRSATG